MIQAASLSRDTTGLDQRPVDLLVIGGGIYGVCSAWEAARCGLSVILVERGDFGQETSSNSLQTMHGGLRYLQKLDLRRMRESIRERRFWLRSAPDQVTPMPFLLPTFGHGLRGPEALQAALALNDLISADRNRGVAASGRLPRGRRLSHAEARGRFGGLQLSGYNGAALWYDGFSSSPERVLISLLRAAAAAGARLLNYFAAEELLREDGRIVGAVVRDLPSGEPVRLRARCVLNAAGPWVDTLADMAGRRSPQALFRPSKALNLVVPRLPFDTAIGLPAPGRVAATYFIIPWGGRSLIGTKHLPFKGRADALRAESGDVLDFLEEINPLLGPQRLLPEDVLAVKCGLLPEQGGGDTPDTVTLQRHARIVDHESEDGIGGLVTVVGVKWTTARLVAQQAVSVILRRLGRPVSADAELPPQWQLPHPPAAMGPDDQPLVSDSTAGRRAFVSAAAGEMAIHLADAVLRRTDLWLSRQLTPQVLHLAAEAMSAVHRWSPSRIEAELGATHEALERRRSWRAGTGAGSAGAYAHQG